MWSIGTGQWHWRYCETFSNLLDSKKRRRWGREWESRIEKEKREWVSEIECVTKTEREREASLIRSWSNSYHSLWSNLPLRIWHPILLSFRESLLKPYPLSLLILPSYIYIYILFFSSHPSYLTVCTLCPSFIHTLISKW